MHYSWMFWNPVLSCLVCPKDQLREGQRSIQAPESLLLEVTTHKAKIRRTQASWAAFGMFVLNGTRQEWTSSKCVGMYGSFGELGTGLSRVGWHLEQHGLALAETRRDQTVQM